MKTPPHDLLEILDEFERTWQAGVKRRRRATAAAYLLGGVVVLVALLAAGVVW